MEHWAGVAGFGGKYEVSSLGRVRSLAIDESRRGPGRKHGAVLKCGLTDRGYVIARLTHDGRAKTVKVHRLVAEAFLANPDGFVEVNHKNLSKQDNRVENLEWCSRKANVRHAAGFWTERAGARISLRDVARIRADKLATVKSVQRDYGLSSTAAHSLLSGKSWAFHEHIEVT